MTGRVWTSVFMVTILCAGGWLVGFCFFACLSVN